MSGSESEEVSIEAEEEQPIIESVLVSNYTEPAQKLLRPIFLKREERELLQVEKLKQE